MVPNHLPFGPRASALLVVVLRLHDGQVPHPRGGGIGRPRGGRPIAVQRLRRQASFRRANGQWREVSLLLIDRGADVNAAIPGSVDTATPLAVASTVGDTALVAALIGKGADVNGAIGANETPLHSAISESHEDVAESLVGAGAKVNARNMSQKTPLHYLAHYMRSGGLAELLIAKGAEVRAKDKEGHTPMDFAKAAGNDTVAEVLRRHGG